MAEISQDWYKQIEPDVIPHAERIWNFLSEDDSFPEPTGNELLLITGNWYDRAKCIRMNELARKYPNAKIILSGGIGTKTGRRARELGGEALEEKECLLGYGISPDRMVIFTGTRHTGSSADFLVDFVKSRPEYQNNPPSVIIVEESYLVRRVKAVFSGRNMGKITSGLSVVSSGAPSFKELVAVHGGNPSVVLHLMSGEMKRLNDYSRDDNEVYLFPRDVAYHDVEKYGGMEAIEVSAEIIRKAHPYEEGLRIMSGDMGIKLQLFEPKYNQH